MWRGQARFDDAIGIFPEFIDGYGVLVLPTTGRYYMFPMDAVRPVSIISSLPAVGRRRSNFACLGSQYDVLHGHGQGAGVAAAVSVKKGVSTAEYPSRTFNAS